MSGFPRPCPFCGERVVVRYSEPDDSRPGAAKTGLTCVKCGGRTATFADGAHALIAWNRREVPRTVIDATKERD